MERYYYFCFKISHEEFITFLLSDLHESELGAMAELSEICNGDSVDFFLPESRPRVGALDFSSLDDMVSYAERNLPGTSDVHIQVIARYITKGPLTEMEEDDYDSFHDAVDDGDVSIDSN